MKKITYYYEETFQPFREIIRQKNKDTIVNESGFKKPELKSVVIIDKENRTVHYTLDDGTVGESRCIKTDIFSETEGIKISYLRAKIKSLQNELDDIIGKDDLND